MSESQTATEDLVCPYCGWIDRDSWEWISGREGSFEATCGSCNRHFNAERCIIVSYNSSPIEGAASG